MASFGSRQSRKIHEVTKKYFGLIQAEAFKTIFFPFSDSQKAKRREFRHRRRPGFGAPDPACLCPGTCATPAEKRGIPPGCLFLYITAGQRRLYSACSDIAPGLQACVQRIQKLFGIEVMFSVPYVVSMNAYRKVLGHFAAFYRLDA